MTRQGDPIARLARTLDPEQVARLAIRGPRYTSFPPAPVWTGEVDDARAAHLLAALDRRRPGAPIALYLHIPFCRRHCTYCACNMVVTHRQDRPERYIDALAEEMDLVQRHLAGRRRAIQIHLGGGTPTFLTPAQLARLWEVITARFDPEDGAEIALEADPVETTTTQLSLLRYLGFNRLSMGVQDFDPGVQEHVGRIQTAARTRELLDYARRLGYRGVNFDLIYGLPRQRPETFAATLDEVCAMRPDRLAIFSYAHVPWLHPQQKKLDEAAIPGPAEKLRLYAMARERLAGEGYVPIGIDHFALPDDPLARAAGSGRLRRNFQGYTVLPDVALIGLGATAIGELEGAYVQNAPKLAAYYARIDAGRLATVRGWVLSAEDRLRRDVIQAIMCEGAVDLAAAGARHGLDAGAVLAEDLARLAAAEAEGLCRREGSRIAATHLGRLFLRNIAMAFDPYLARGGGGRYSRAV